MGSSNNVESGGFQCVDVIYFTGARSSRALRRICLAIHVSHQRETAFAQVVSVSAFTV